MPRDAFNRAAARDFADSHVLAHRFRKEVLLARAAQIDAGFAAKVLAERTGLTVRAMPIVRSRGRPDRGWRPAVSSRSLRARRRRQ
jgi:hypothetical protein